MVLKAKAAVTSGIPARFCHQDNSMYHLSNLKKTYYWQRKKMYILTQLQDTQTRVFWVFKEADPALMFRAYVFLCASLNYLFLATEVILFRQDGYCSCAIY